MSIVSIESFGLNDVLMVRVTADDGSFGWGQATPFMPDVTELVLHRQVAPLALGKDERDFSLADKLITALYKFTGTYICRATAGIDTALWDLNARREGKSVSEYAGKKRSIIPVYGSSMQRDLPIEQEVGRMVRLKEKFGYEAFKLHVMRRNGRNEDYWPNRTEELVALARRELGDDVELYVDPNGAYTPERALVMGKYFLDYGVTLLEEPCPYWEVEQIAAVRKAFASTPLELACGEQDYVMAQWRRIISLPAADFVQPDICYVGGFTRALQVAEQAAAAGLRCSPHTSNHSMVLPFGLHFMAIISNPWKRMEHSIESNRFDFLTATPTVSDSLMAVPDGPGWGVQPTEQWLNSVEYRISKL